MTVAALPFTPAPEPPLPAIARTGLILFLGLLPFHSLGIALLYGVAGVPADTARVVAAWKEAAVAILVVWVVMRAVTGHGPKASIAAPDVALGVLFTLALIALVVANPLFRVDIPASALLYGFRDTVFFMALYYVGRGAPELASTEASLKAAFLLALVVSVVGIVERVVVSPDMLVLFGVASYVNEFLGMTAYTVGNDWGLPQNYWSTLGGIQVRRAGSVFLHSQGFALPFLLLMPAATAWALNRRRAHPVLTRFGYALIWLGLLLTLTRFTILICVAQMALYYVMNRKPEWAVMSAVVGAGIFAIAMLFVPGLPSFVWETLSWQTASSTSHLRDWTHGLVAFLEQPWGHGLGTTDAVAVRFLRPPMSSDNMYLSYAVQLGLAGIVAFVALLLGILAKSWNTFRSTANDEHRRFSGTMVLATLGILVNGITSIVFSSNLLAYVFFLFAGAVVTVSQLTGSARTLRV